jgi:tetratricopeptide (TPR) repeat protein
MYLKGSKWSMNRRRSRKRPNIFRIVTLIGLIAAVVYVNQVIVPETDPLFVPTPTATRAPESFVTEAENLLAQGKMIPAIAIYEDAIRADPQNVSNYITAAQLQVLTGDYEGAATNAENALLLSPNNSMAHAVRGWALGFLDDFLAGEASLNTAVEFDPNNGIAYSYYTELLVLQNEAGLDALGSLDKAVEASRMAEALAPNTMESHRARGLVLELTGNYKEAIGEFEAAVALNNNVADLHLALGRNYRYIQDYALAVEEFSRANTLNPSDPLPDIYISRTYATVGEFAKAIQYAEQAVKDAPTDPSMRGNLGSMLYRNRQYSDAVEHLGLATRGGFDEEGIEVEGMPLDYGRIAEYYYTYGLALARLGECGEALQIAQTLQQGVANDEIAVYNAQEMINICQQMLEYGTPTPVPVEATEQPEGE